MPFGWWGWAAANRTLFHERDMRVRIAITSLSVVHVTILVGWQHTKQTEGAEDQIIWPITARRGSLTALLDRLPLLGAIGLAQGRERQREGQVERQSRQNSQSAKWNQKYGLQVRVPSTSVKTCPGFMLILALSGERTFFSWLRVALLLGSFALALFNGGDKIGSRMGMVYAIISMGMVRASRTLERSYHSKR